MTIVLNGEVITTAAANLRRCSPKSNWMKRLLQPR